MRRLVMIVVLVLLSAGCVNGSDPRAPLTPATGHPAPGDGEGQATSDPAEEGASSPSRPATPSPGAQEPRPDTGSFCEDEATCMFWDDDHHELALYDVDTPTLDVLIVPSLSLDGAQDTRTIRAALAAWADGVRTLGAPWMANAFALRVYVLGEDVPLEDALLDPEIIILAAEYDPVLLFGIGYQLPPTPCRSAATHTYPIHAHDGMLLQAAQCEQGGYTCLALHTNFLQGSRNQLHDLVTHEVGHCLGVGHVGDALDFSAKTVPIRDIMSYQHDPDQVHCVSTLNVRVLEGIYASLVSAATSTPLRAGEFLDMPTRDYAQVSCANPT